jgi:hypothetical protein
MGWLCWLPHQGDHQACRLIYSWFCERKCEVLELEVEDTRGLIISLSFRPLEDMAES